MPCRSERRPAKARFSLPDLPDNRQRGVEFSSEGWLLSPDYFRQNCQELFGTEFLPFVSHILQVNPTDAGKQGEKRKMTDA